MRRYLADLGAGQASFLDLALLYFVAALRDHGVKKRSVWRELRDLGQRRGGDPYAVLSERVLIAGDQAWVEELEHIVAMGSGALGLADIIRQVGAPIEMEDGAPARIRVRNYERLVIDPARGLGRPTVRGTRLDTRTAAKIIRAERGDLGVLERSYGLTADVVAEVQDFERGAA